MNYRENEVKKDETTGRMTDTGKVLNRAILFSEDNHGEDWMSQARIKANEGPKRSCVVKMK